MEKTVSWYGLRHLFVVYVVWGSTYLGIKLANCGGEGLPPFLLVGSRLFAGGLIMIAWGLWNRSRIMLRWKEFILCFFVAQFLWVSSNGVTALALTYIDSSYAGIFVGTSPIWTALIESAFRRQWPPRLLLGSIAIAMIGLVCLIFAHGGGGGQAATFPVMLLLWSAFSWAFGSILQGRWPMPLDPVVSAAYQQILAVPGLLLLSYFTGETWNFAIPFSAWMGWTYLVIFGSVIAFLSYIKSIERLPLIVVSSFAYVNPVITVLLGVLVLGEDLNVSELLAMVLILVAVFGIFRARFNKKPAPTDPEAIAQSTSISPTRLSLVSNHRHWANKWRHSIGRWIRS